MRIRNTSKKAYEELLNSGFFETRRGQVYQVLQARGPMTQMEVVKLLKESSPHITEHSFTPRFAELERIGLIKATSKRRCNITSKTALVWEADPENRLISIKPQSKHQRIKDLEATLERVAKAKSLKEVRQIIGLETSDYTAPVLRLNRTSIEDLFE